MVVIRSVLVDLKSNHGPELDFGFPLENFPVLTENSERAQKIKRFEYPYWLGLEQPGAALSGLEWPGVAWSGLEGPGGALSGLVGPGVAWRGLE